MESHNKRQKLTICKNNIVVAKQELFTLIMTVNYRPVNYRIIKLPEIPKKITDNTYTRRFIQNLI